MEGWTRTGIRRVLAADETVSFSIGVILSLTYDLFIETIFFLASPPPFVLVMVAT